MPTKTCAKYVEEDCLAVFPAISRHVGALVSAAKEMASCILEGGGGSGLNYDQVFALASYTLDVSQYAIGAPPEENYFLVLNEALRRRDPLVLRQLVGYLHYFLLALQDLPKEPEADFYRGIHSDSLQVFADSMQHAAMILIECCRDNHDAR